MLPKALRYFVRKAFLLLAFLKSFIRYNIARYFLFDNQSSQIKKNKKNNTYQKLVRIKPL